MRVDQQAFAAPAAPQPTLSVVMLVQNEPYPQDVRVRAEAETLAAAGHVVTVIAPRDAGQRSRERVGEVRVIRYRMPEARSGVPGFLGEYAVAHAQLVPRGLRALLGGADVIHLHNPPDTLFPLALAARALGRRAVFDQHDLFPELVAARTGSPQLERLARLAQHASLRSASAIVVTNESQREVALERVGADPGRVTVVRNGPPRSTLGIRAPGRPGALEKPRLVFVGALAPQDGVLDLPDLLREAPLRHAHLTVIGDGPCREALQGTVSQSHDLSSRVRFTGRVDHGRVPTLLAEADIGIDPAPCGPFNHRSTMVKIGEYLAATLPVVAYDLLETRRTAGDAALFARCGDRQDFAERVARLAREQPLRAELVARASERAEDLVWERSAEALLRLYEEFAASRPRPRSPSSLHR
jgi:glycosyltransferase involved in cell wall biosynthesis